MVEHRQPLLIGTAATVGLVLAVCIMVFSDVTIFFLVFGPCLRKKPLSGQEFRRCMYLILLAVLSADETVSRRRGQSTLRINNLGGALSCDFIPSSAALVFELC
jgi:hypothetical protein